MNWLTKLARRRYKPKDRVRFFVSGRKGTGKGIVLTPDFQTGTVVNFDPISRHYDIQDDEGKPFKVNPRNIARD